MVAIITPHTTRGRPLNDERNKPHQPLGSEEEPCSAGVAKQVPPEAGVPNDRILRLVGWKHLQLRKDLFTDYVETYQYSIFDSHSQP
jgi:hypothetical protein